MDFLTTARLLMDMREKNPEVRYTFEQSWSGEELVIRIPVEADVPQAFLDAARLFSPNDD